MEWTTERPRVEDSDSLTVDDLEKAMLKIRPILIEPEKDLFLTRDAIATLNKATGEDHRHRLGCMNVKIIPDIIARLIPGVAGFEMERMDFLARPAQLSPINEPEEVRGKDGGG
jgi:hypothetical protein